MKDFFLLPVENPVAVWRGLGVTAMVQYIAEWLSRERAELVGDLFDEDDHSACCCESAGWWWCPVHFEQQ